MNEDLKNIETCLPESILAEVASVPTDAQFRSLTDEALDPLKQQAFQQAGSDAYNEVVAQHQPYTFTSQVKQMKSNLILLLRRLWRYPFGTAPLRSLSDMWQHYITRLSGNAEYGIPSRLSQLTDLPSAPLLVSDRKISGVPEAVDGISLVQLCLDSTVSAEIETVTDETTGWTMNRSFNNLFQNAKTVTLGCKYMQADRANYFNNLSSLEELELTDCEMISGDWSYGSGSNHKIIGNNDALRKFKTPGLKELRSTTSWSQCPLLVSNPVLEEWYSPKFEKTNCSYMVHNCPNLQRVVFGKLIADFVSAYGSYGENFTGSNSKMVHFEIGAGTAVSLHLDWWNPSYVLSDNPTGTDLIEEGSTAQNNLQQFLQNFRDYIADRLTDNGSGKTLTLSQAVFSAVIEGASPICDDIKGIIEDKGWKVQDTNNNIFPTT